MPNSKARLGTVTGTSMTNTVIVTVERMKKHPLYQKQFRVTKKYHVDTNGQTLAIGDTVKIEETRPISKTKSWRVVEKV